LVVKPEPGGVEVAWAEADRADTNITNPSVANAQSNFENICLPEPKFASKYAALFIFSL
jgi:hypothetical protein